MSRLQGRSRILGQQQDLSKENGSLEIIRADRQVRCVAERKLIVTFLHGKRHGNVFKIVCFEGVLLLLGSIER